MIQPADPLHKGLTSLSNMELVREANIPPGASPSDAMHGRAPGEAARLSLGILAARDAADQQHQQSQSQMPGSTVLDQITMGQQRGLGAMQPDMTAPPVGVDQLGMMQGDPLRAEVPAVPAPMPPPMPMPRPPEESPMPMRSRPSMSAVPRGGLPAGMMGGGVVSLPTNMSYSGGGIVGYANGGGVEDEENVSTVGAGTTKVRPTTTNTAAPPVDYRWGSMKVQPSAEQLKRRAEYVARQEVRRKMDEEARRILESQGVTPGGGAYGSALGKLRERLIQEHYASQAPTESNGSKTDPRIIATANPDGSISANGETLSNSAINSLVEILRDQYGAGITDPRSLRRMLTRTALNWGAGRNLGESALLAFETGLDEQTAARAAATEGLTKAMDFDIRLKDLMQKTDAQRQKTIAEILQAYPNMLSDYANTYLLNKYNIEDPREATRTQTEEANDAAINELMRMSGAIVTPGKLPESTRVTGTRVIK